MNHTCEALAQMVRLRALGPLLACAAALLSAQSVAARRGGIVAEGCEGCHRAGQEPAVQILASPANPAPGQTVAISVEIEAVNGSVGGLYLRLDGEGALSPAASSGLRAIGPDQVVHATPRTASNGVVRFALSWTPPPSPGGAIFRAWVVSANGNDSSSGDGAAVAELLLAYGCSGELYTLDPDGDGYGAVEYGQKRDCSVPAGYSQRDGDCAEYDPQIHPDAAELCNDKDDDCDGQADEALPIGPQYPDADGDGYASSGAAEPIEDCSSPKGYAAERGDCNDKVATVHPEATETCNSVDDDCDGRTDEKARADCGVGWCRRLSDSCSPEFCTPGMPRAEMCNYLDDDCDGATDEGTPCPAGEQCIEGRCTNGTAPGAGSGAAGGRGAAQGQAGRAGAAPSAGSGDPQPAAAGSAAPNGGCPGAGCGGDAEPAGAAGGCAASPASPGAPSGGLASLFVLALLARCRTPSRFRARDAMRGARGARQRWNSPA